jgi:hypothetical protein
MPTSALALALALAGTVIEPPPAAELQARPVQVLQTAAQVRTLCEVLVPPERLRARGDAVQRARAGAEHERQRVASLGSRYRMVVPGDRLRFTAWDPEEKRLALSERVFLAGAGGALVVWAVEERGLPVIVDADAAARIMEAAARHELELDLTFNLPDDDDEVVCVHRNGAARWGLGVEPVAWAYAARGQALARGGEGADRPAVTAEHGARARVEVGEPVGDERPGLRGAVEARAPDLQGCYREALRANPALDGSLVADLQLSSEGAARQVRVAVDSLQDDGLAACVRGVLAHTSFPRGEARAAIPIRFSLEEPTASRGTGSAR